MQVQLKYGEDMVSLSLDGAEQVTYLEEKPVPVIQDLKEAFLRAVTVECVESAPLRDVFVPEDKVTIVVSDITRYWMRPDKICPLLVSYLCEEIGVPEKNIIFLVALGTHRPQTPEEMEKLLSPEVCRRFSSVNHDCLSPDLVEVGVTARGTHVRVNPLVVGRKVILLSGTVHHLMSGFGGGRKSILPGVSAQSTINQNHIHALDLNAPRSNPLIGMGILTENPVHEDMVEAAAYVKPAFGVNLVVNGRSEHCAIVCGHWLKAWEKSCRMVQEFFGLPIAHKADVVIASCGGYPKDINLYQAVKTLLNAAQAVKDGGTLVFLARCQEGGGTPAFFDWIKPLAQGRLDEALREHFTIAGYIFYAACEAIRKGKVLMLTELPADTVAPMALEACQSVEELRRRLIVQGKQVYVMPFGGSIVPFVPEKQ